MIGASINAMNKDNHASLHHSVRNGQYSTVELLLMNGASIEAKDEDLNTPLHLAVWRRHPDFSEATS